MCNILDASHPSRCTLDRLNVTINLLLVSNTQFPHCHSQFVVLTGNICGLRNRDRRAWHWGGGGVERKETKKFSRYQILDEFLQQRDLLRLVPFTAFLPIRSVTYSHRYFRMSQQKGTVPRGSKFTTVKT